MFIFILILVSLLAAVYLFLNRNTALSFILLVILDIVFLWFHSSVSKSGWVWLLFAALLWWDLTATEAPHRLVPAAIPHADETEAVEVHEGRVSGAYTADHAVEVYAGIPYAKPPVGNLRWKEPQAPDPYTKTLRAVNFAPEAMQKETPMFLSSLSDILFYHNWDHVLHDRRKNVMSEDCLYLNIWKPAGKKENLPVVFYIHGGSLTTGQSWWEDYRGENYARQDVIFVTFTYRLGAFGFYADEDLQKESSHHTTGMYGFLDQIQALKWVNQNISAFGGDPGNITIAGESAGSSSVNAMCVSPLAKGLFRRAIAESSSISTKNPAHSFLSLEKAKAGSASLKKAFRAKNVQELRQLPASAIVNAKWDFSSLCALTDDGYALTESPYESLAKGVHNEEALLNGFNAKDGDFFASFSAKPKKENIHELVQAMYQEHTDEVLKGYEIKDDASAKEAYLKLYNPFVFTFGHENWSAMSAEKEPVYEYIFTKTNQTIGPQHTGELKYAYGNLEITPSLYDDSDRKLSETMQAYWLNFIRTGNPNGAGLPEWKTYEEDTIMELGQHTGMIPDPYQKINPLIDSIQNQ
jgi:para-nitrobenzyl esterase